MPAPTRNIGFKDRIHLSMAVPTDDPMAEFVQWLNDASQIGSLRGFVMDGLYKRFLSDTGRSEPVRAVREQVAQSAVQEPSVDAGDQTRLMAQPVRPVQVQEAHDGLMETTAVEEGGQVASDEPRTEIQPAPIARTPEREPPSGGFLKGMSVM